MEKIVKKMLESIGVSKSDSRLISQLVLRDKEKLEDISNERSKKLIEKTDLKIAQLQEKIIEEKEKLSEKIDSELEKIIEKEIHSHINYLGISVKNIGETEKVFEQNENQNEEKINQNHSGNHSTYNHLGGQNYGN